MSTDLLHVQSQSVKKTVGFFLVASVMCSCRLKESQFSNAQFDLEKCATAKPGHLYGEEAKEKIPTISFGKRRKRRTKLPVKPQKGFLI